MITRTATVVADGYTLLEGPRWHQGALWASDFHSHRVLRFAVRGAELVDVSTICEVPGKPSGLGFMPDGELRISSMNDRRLLAWDGSALRTVAELSAFVTGPANDLIIDSAGNAFIGNFGLDPGRPREARPTPLLRVTPDGTVSIAADDTVFPNGMVLDEDAGLFYLAETYRSRIDVFDVNEGRLSHRRTWVRFAPDPGSYDIPDTTELLDILPDGIAMDAEGMMWVANSIGPAGRGAIRVDAGGRVVEAADTGALSVYAVALGGPDGRDLYLCCAPAAESFDPETSSRAALLHCRVDVGVR